jgi:acetyl esterase/lipase
MVRVWLLCIRVTVSRIRRGRGLPRWTWMHEVILTGMKREFVRLAPLSWDLQRRTWRAIALPAFAVRGARFERTALAGRDAVWVTPNDVPRDRPKEEGATVLYLHGGAYLFGTIDEYLDFAMRIGREAHARAVVVDYRLAPEHPFPAALELRGLPPMLVQVGGAEMILDQVVAFAGRAREAGVDARLRVWEDCFHDWPLFASLLDDGKRAVEETGAFVRQVTGSDGG